jgi:hypothetical protein
MLHELTHAAQLCNQPVGTDPYGAARTPQERINACCDLEGEAYRRQCQVMVESGVFEGTAFNAETCAQVLTDASCRQREIFGKGVLPDDAGACPWSYTYDKSFDETMTIGREVFAIDLAWTRANGQPETCQEVLNPRAPLTRDPRIDSAVLALEGSGHDVCTPLATTVMNDTIGNTTCLLNRCWTESFTEHRMIPGRATLTAGENAYPFDACIRPDPQLGTVIPAASPSTDWVPPPYRPAELRRYLLESLCPGMPLGSPLCTFDPVRRTDLPPTDLIQLMGGLTGGAIAFQEPVTALRQMSEAIGIRIGTRMYSDFLERKSRALTDFAVEAAALLSQFPKVTFPDVMCPLNSVTDPLCTP